MSHVGVVTIAAASSVQSLGALPGWTALLTIAVIIILAGLVVLLGRYILEVRPRASSDSSSGTSDVTSSLVRSWIAISMVSGLLIFCAEALSLKDTALRSTLFGGLVSSVGAAVAFYFSSKNSDKARQDFMTATQSAYVPDLKGKSVPEALKLMASSPLRLDLDSEDLNTNKKILHQSIPAGTLLRNGTVVKAILEKELGNSDD